MTLQERDKQYLWHPFTAFGEDDPLLITSAEGVYLHTHDGRKIVDAISSWWVNLHGHSHPIIAKAIAEQAQKLEHVMFAGFTHEPAILLAENLLSILPKNQSKIFLSDNGSTAVEVALKMAIQFWYNQNITNKKKVIAIEGSYHGDTFGSMSVGARDIFITPFNPYLFSVEFIEFPSQEKENQVIEQFKKLVCKGDVGVFIFEPLVQGASGMRIYRPEVLDELMAIARDQGVVCIADEVFTGFGRTGKIFASDYLKTSPDLIAMSKGLTGGALPLGATSCSRRIEEVFRDSSANKTFYHGHSYTGNPMSCAAANASIKILLSAECQNSINRISHSFNDFALRYRQTDNRLKSAQRLGCILSLELESSSATSYQNPLRKEIYRHFLSRHILLRPLGNILYVTPPYVTPSSVVENILYEIESFIHNSSRK
ncbi:MAG: adenosylmethionine--8-amino-7-oxononanoate transaminase [Bacteroidota bacterium]|jgi:adenosylmethionine-8-amino-7-oxononanoate aminotransferase|nr:adenosylmethionine--8-amino-7-oxononanoate transaminase [Cytophagales bacterium]MCE2956380.1 adenosylmethionine--8-amino-7-oxononanoate transaminase [Flammeovirgaceae bacterium]MCZ8071370.1 adenosylmethionine--8-amino-7-oxononanoate transaminase [Cytophagales bacterium]